MTKPSTNVSLGPGDLISGPPRDLHVGDIVVTYNRHLGAWTAAQIIRHAPACYGTTRVVVLELDWSGSEPHHVDELAGARGLGFTHQFWKEELYCLALSWTLPKSYKVLGNLPPLTTRDIPFTTLHAWEVGDQLARQRAQDLGVDFEDDGEATYTGREFKDLPPGEKFLNIVDLTVKEIDQLDCAELVERFPNLERLSLGGGVEEFAGRMGELRQAHRLNDLSELRRLAVTGLFGMTANDLLDPEKVPNLEWLYLNSTPRGYALVMKKHWIREAPSGVDVDVRRTRSKDWLEANRDNPFWAW